MSAAVDDEVARLAVRCGGLGAPIVAIELQWSVADELDGVWWEFAVCAIITGAGALDSRFRSHRLHAVRAETPAERAQAAALARALAAHLGVEACVPALDTHGGPRGSRWIEAQGAPPVAPYQVRWELQTWSDAGERVEEMDETTVLAISGRAARDQLERELMARAGGPARPVVVRSVIDGVDAGGWYCMRPPRPAGLPVADELHAWHRAGHSISTIAGTLRARIPRPTVLEVMRVLEDAFMVSLDALAPVAAWGAGRISAADLDTALDHAIVARRPDWDRPRRLREAHARGGSLAAALRTERADGAGTVALMKSLRTAFSIPLVDAKDVVDRLDGDDDGRDDAVLAAAIAAVADARPASTAVCRDVDEGSER